MWYLRNALYMEQMICREIEWIIAHDYNWWELW
jgi:hypothetical protein